MSVYKEEKTGTWRVLCRYTDWTGAKKQTQKRGFKTKREAQAWEREQMNLVSSSLDMTFQSLVDRYRDDKAGRIKEKTWEMKNHIIHQPGHHPETHSSEYPLQETNCRISGDV